MATSAARAVTADSATQPGAPLALQQLLGDTAVLLLGIDATMYVARPAERVSGSVGEHVRHLLDHVAALVAADPGVALSYDHRERGTAVEIDPAAALRQILRLQAALGRWAERPLDTPVRVTSRIDAGGPPVVGWSTLGRELAFVVSHTIHHQAMIALLLAVQGMATPERFGYAPSTPA
jgi:uncharacterized damage-inducible protein DinB